MYNLSVETAHTFFVGEGQWLVHNCPTNALTRNDIVNIGTPHKSDPFNRNLFGDFDDAKAVFDSLTQGGNVVSSGQGITVIEKGGVYYTLRDVSKSSTGLPTIDINFRNGQPPIKWKWNP
jgi:hypothetical protein